MNTSLSLAQQINIRASKKNIPISAFIELTYNCNHDCYYCFQKAYTKPPELSAQQWKRILSQLADCGTLYITFSGGEPFLHPEFFEILTEARKLQFAVSIITNGSCITNAAAQKLSDLAITSVGISFHAAEQKLHDSLSGVSGSYHKALHALHLLKSCGIHVSIKHSISSENFGQYKALQEFSKNEDCALECDSTILPLEQGSVSDYALHKEQLSEFLSDWPLTTSLHNQEFNSQSNLHCDAGRSLCGICPDGTIVPCILLPYYCGNCTSQSFVDIWYGQKIEIFRHNELVLNNTCETCSLQSACSRCHAVAYWETRMWNSSSKSMCERAAIMNDRYNGVK